MKTDSMLGSYNEGWVLGEKTEVVYLPAQNQRQMHAQRFQEILKRAVRTAFIFSFGFGILLEFSFKIEVWIQRYSEIGYGM